MRKIILALALLFATPAAAQQQTMPRGAYMGPADATSGVVTGAVVSVTMPGVANQINMLTGLEITSDNVASGCYTLNLTGILTTAIPFLYCVPGGQAEPLPIIAHFDPPLVASGSNTAIVMSSTGAIAAGDHAVITLHGFRIQ